MNVVKPSLVPITYAKNTHLALTNKAIMAASEGRRSVGWIKSVIQGARKMSKAL